MLVEKSKAYFLTWYRLIIGKNILINKHSSVGSDSTAYGRHRQKLYWWLVDLARQTFWKDQETTKVVPAVNVALKNQGTYYGAFAVLQILIRL